MSDLISREALLKSLNKYQSNLSEFSLGHDYLDDVEDLITNAPAIPPQQAQSVADALEDVAKIVNENIKSLEIRKSKVLDDAEIYNYYENDICTLKPIEEAIRALIKRNAPKEGE